MLKEYDVVHSEHEYERSPRRLELAEEYREYVHNPTLFAALSLLLNHPHPLLTLQWTSPVSASSLCP